VADEERRLARDRRSAHDDAAEEDLVGLRDDRLPDERCGDRDHGEGDHRGVVARRGRRSLLTRLGLHDVALVIRPVRKP
jgi:hypothetical protein